MLARVEAKVDCAKLVFAQSTLGSHCSERRFLSQMEIGSNCQRVQPPHFDVNDNESLQYIVGCESSLTIV